MTAYFIFMREGPVQDAAEMAAYMKKLSAAPRDPNMKVLSLYGALEGVEGRAPDGIVLLEFPTVEAAKAWYESPAYQEALPHRRDSAEWRGVLLEGGRSAPR